ncbi:MAG TPA: amidohydrolase family protein, partial [Fimbriimonas sp.]|nr:amidohydrolase family protein [Fimbriimonas sp.]
MMLPFKVGEHCAYGLSQEAALRALTLDAATIFGVEDRLGSIEVGKLGNVIVTDGDPFELTTTMRYVFINGQPRKLESKHTRLRDKYMERVK